MSKDVLWIAMRDGTGWASSRTRDLTDLAFTVYKADSAGDVIVTVRKPNRDDDPTSRATQIIAGACFDYVSEAKNVIIDALVTANDTGADQADARRIFNEYLMTHSKIHVQSFMMVDHKRKSQSDVMMTSATAFASPVTVDEEVANLTEATPRMQEWMDMVDSLSSAFDMNKAVEAMVATPVVFENTGDALDVPMHPLTKSIVEELMVKIEDASEAKRLADDVKEAFSILNQTEAVQEVVAPAFNPETWQPGEEYPSEYMLIGNRLIKMEWPK